MKKFTILFISLFLMSCEKNAVAALGEPMWIVLNHVKADKRQQFEKFAYDVLLPALKENAKTNLSTKNLISQTRMLEPTRMNQDSSYTYIWLMDPIVQDGDYGYESNLSQFYSPEEVKMYVSMADSCLVTPQVGYRLKQGIW